MSLFSSKATDGSRLLSLLLKSELLQDLLTSSSQIPYQPQLLHPSTCIRFLYQ